MPPDHNVLKEIEQLEQRFAENAQGLVFAHLADAYRRAGEFAKAEGLLLHGLKTHPTYTSAYNVLGRVYLDSERFADAHEQFSKVLELDPQNLIALRALGDLAACGGRIDDARSWYERMLQIDPRSDEAQVGLRRLKGGDVEAAAAGAPEATEAVELEEVTGAEAAEEAFGETAEAAEPWAIDAPSAEGSEETSAEPTAEPGEGLLTGEGKAASSEADDRLAAEAQVEGSEAADSDAEGGAFGLEGLDLGIMDDWTPGFIDGDAVPDEPVADEPSDDDVADSLFEGMIGARGSSVEEEAKPEATGDLVADSIFEGLSGIPDSLSGEPGADEQLVSDVVAESIFEGLSGIPDSMGAEDATAEAAGDVVADSIFEGLSDTFNLDPDSAARVVDESEEGWAEDELEEAVELTEGLVTETMAELYADQGLYADSLKIYRQLLERRPSDERLQRRINELERQLIEARSTSPADHEELAELLELTQPTPAETEPDEPEEVVEERDRGVAAVQVGEFSFEDEAPIAGIEQLDPFAASFDVMAVSGPSTPSVAGPVERTPDAVTEPEHVAGEGEEEETVAAAEASREELAAGPVDVWDLAAESVEEAEGTEPPVAAGAEAEPSEIESSVVETTPISDIFELAGEVTAIEVTEEESLEEVEAAAEPAFEFEPVADVESEPEPAAEFEPAADIEAELDTEPWAAAAAEPPKAETREAEPAGPEVPEPELTGPLSFEVAEPEAVEVEAESPEPSEVTADDVNAGWGEWAVQTTEDEVEVEETAEADIVGFTVEMGETEEAAAAGMPDLEAEPVSDATDLEAELVLEAPDLTAKGPVEQADEVLTEVPADFVATEMVADYAPPEPPLEAMAEAEHSDEVPTIEEYLSSLLAFDPHPSAFGQGDESSGAAEEPESDGGAGDSDDLEQFQEWLRSLKR